MYIWFKFELSIFNGYSYLIKVTVASNISFLKVYSKFIEKKKKVIDSWMEEYRSIYGL